VIFASGTLSPLSTYTSELQTHFNVRLENDHVIDRSQVMLGIITNGCDGRELNFGFK